MKIPTSLLATTLASLLLLSAPATANFYLWSVIRSPSPGTVEDVFVFVNPGTPNCDIMMNASGYHRLNNVSQQEGVRLVGRNVSHADIVEYNVRNLSGHVTWNKLDRQLVRDPNVTVGNCSRHDDYFRCENVSGFGVLYCYTYNQAWPSIT